MFQNDQKKKRFQVCKSNLNQSTIDLKKAFKKRISEFFLFTSCLILSLLKKRSEQEYGKLNLEEALLQSTAIFFG
jgi:hypothetical protein